MSAGYEHCQLLQGPRSARGRAVTSCVVRRPGDLLEGGRWGISVDLRRSGKSSFTGAFPEALWAGVLLDGVTPANTSHPSCETACLLPYAWRQWPAAKCMTLRADVVGC